VAGRYVCVGIDRVTRPRAYVIEITEQDRRSRYGAAMEPVLAVAGLWVLFIGTHIGLATSPIRGALHRRLGPSGFLALYVIVASIAFAALAACYAAVRDVGPPGLALAALPFARSLLIGAIVLGFVLMTGALAPQGYWTSPIAVLADGVRAPFGLERVTRHPFFTGVVLAMGSHALLATHLTGTVFCAGFVLLALAGPMHQTAKLRAQYGEAFDRFLARTSAVPFLAILRGHQRFVAREMPWVSLALGLVVAAVVRFVHDGMFDAYGAPLTIAVAGGGAVIGMIALWIHPEPGQVRRAQ
jgi:uncharacterized membrane protein